MSLELPRVREENEQLRAALEPFAKLAEFISENHRDSRPLLYGLDAAVLGRLTIGDLRKARMAFVAGALPPGPLKVT